MSSAVCCIVQRLNCTTARCAPPSTATGVCYRPRILPSRDRQGAGGAAKHPAVWNNRQLSAKVDNMRRISQLRSPLDRVFSRPSHLAVLRALKDSREGMSGRAVAREAGVNHQAGAVAIRSLEAMGLVQRLGSGHTQMIHLNFDHHLVAELILPLLRREGDLLSAIRRDIVRTFTTTPSQSRSSAAWPAARTLLVAISTS